MATARRSLIGAVLLVTAVLAMHGVTTPTAHAVHVAMGHPMTTTAMAPGAEAAHSLDGSTVNLMPLIAAVCTAIVVCAFGGLIVRLDRRQRLPRTLDHWRPSLVQAPDPPVPRSDRGN